MIGKKEHRTNTLASLQEKFMELFHEILERISPPVERKLDILSWRRNERKGQEVTNEKSGCWDILLRIQVFGQKENFIPVSFVFPMTVRFLSWLEAISDDKAMLKKEQYARFLGENIHSKNMCSMLTS